MSKLFKLMIAAAVRKFSFTACSGLVSSETGFDLNHRSSRVLPTTTTMAGAIHSDQERLTGSPRSLVSGVGSGARSRLFQAFLAREDLGNGTLCLGDDVHYFLAAFK